MHSSHSAISHLLYPALPAPEDTGQHTDLFLVKLLLGYRMYVQPKYPIFEIQRTSLKDLIEQYQHAQRPPSYSFCNAWHSLPSEGQKPEH